MYSRRWSATKLSRGKRTLEDIYPLLFSRYTHQDNQTPTDEHFMDVLFISEISSTRGKPPLGTYIPPSPDTLLLGKDSKNQPREMIDGCIHHIYIPFYSQWQQRQTNVGGHCPHFLRSFSPQTPKYLIGKYTIYYTILSTDGHRWMKSLIVCHHKQAAYCTRKTTVVRVRASFNYSIQFNSIRLFIQRFNHLRWRKILR